MPYWICFCPIFHISKLWINNTRDIGNCSPSPVYYIDFLIICHHKIPRMNIYLIDSWWLILHIWQYFCEICFLDLMWKYSFYFFRYLRFYNLRFRFRCIIFLHIYNHSLKYSSFRDYIILWKWSISRRNYEIVFSIILKLSDIFWKLSWNVICRLEKIVLFFKLSRFSNSKHHYSGTIFFCTLPLMLYNIYSPYENALKFK